MYLGPECKVDLNKFRGHPLGTSKLNPAQSCKQIHDIMSSSGKLKNGVYWIKTSADHSVQTYCDLTNGGWTLVGKVSGFVEKLHSFWLIKNHNVDALNSPGLPRYVIYHNSSNDFWHAKIASTVVNVVCFHLEDNIKFYLFVLQQSGQYGWPLLSNPSRVNCNAFQR